MRKKIQSGVILALFAFTLGSGLLLANQSLAGPCPGCKTSSDAGENTGSCMQCQNQTADQCISTSGLGPACSE